MRELFVYYRVPTDDAEAALALVRSLQTRLRAAYPGLIARLLHRPDATAGLQTWMETYAAPGADVGPELQVTIEAWAAALLPLIDGSRHTEVFVTCDA